MEHAPLRPVPSRRPSAVDPAEAVRHVAGELPALDAPAAEALALVALVGRSRDEVAGRAGLSREQLAEALARARKALRRRLHPLPGSGWCERAERLISDRLDDALQDPGPARLRVHLANCSRCLEHERRLAQAHDALVAGFLDSTAPPREAARWRAEADAELERPLETNAVPPAPLRIVEAGERPPPPPSPPPAPVRPDDPAMPPQRAPEQPAAADAPTAPEDPAEAPALPQPGEPAPPSTRPAAPVRLGSWEQPFPAPSPYLPQRATTGDPPGRQTAPPPARSRLAAVYAPVPRADSSRPLADEETWTVIGPLLVIFTLAIVLLAFAVLMVMP